MPYHRRKYTAFSDFNISNLDQVSGYIKTNRSDVHNSSVKTSLESVGDIIRIAANAFSFKCTICCKQR